LSTANDARRTVDPSDGATDAGGWDAHEVWRERVREARSRAARDPGRPPAAPPGPTPGRGGDGGWDPADTWRDRVLEPRRR
jgi:hypothetical protein